MTSIISTGSQSVVAATSITVPLGSTPTSGELVLVILATSNQIVVHPPGWNTIPPGGQVNQLAWFKAQSLQAPDSSTLHVFYHTWNSADSGSSAVFTFTIAPGLGIGDKDLSNASAQAIAVVLSASAVQEYSQQGSLDPVAMSLLLPPQKQANAGAFNFTALFENANAALSTSDGSAILVNSLSTAQGSVSVWRSAGSVGYRPTLSSNVPGSLVGAFLTVNDATPNIYNAPVIYEAPAGDSDLFFRFTHQRYYTVFNNSGTFSVGRFPTTDQIAAATQVFTGNSPIRPADYTNLLNAGVGGDFRYSITGS